METIASRIYKPAEFSAGQVHEMLVTLGRKGFSPEMAAEVANTRSGKAEQVVGLFRHFPTLEDLIADQRGFYHKFFGQDLDFSQVRIPEKRVGFDRLIIVAQGLTPNQVYEACAKHFPCWRYTDDMDKATAGLNEREPTESYAIWVRDRIEADEELKGRSANQLKEDGVSGITLLERLVYEFKYWSETRNHLDIDNVTLCAGSRGRDGFVPAAHWVGDVFKVVWCDPRDADDLLRSREAVS